MKIRQTLTSACFLVLFGFHSLAIAAESNHDPRALDLLKKMAAYTDTLDQIVIKGEVFSDARLDAGLMISNPSEINVMIDRPGSLVLKSFDGIDTQQIYIHNKELTIFNSDNNFYARASVPAEIDQAMRVAIEQFDLDIPLGELFFGESALELLTAQDSLVYLTDKSRIRGVDCHHIVIRGPETDLQLWIEEGDQPVPRKVLMTMKWENGSPRHTTIIDFDATSGLESKSFEFDPPEGALEIQFVGSD